MNAVELEATFRQPALELRNGVRAVVVEVCPCCEELDSIETRQSDVHELLARQARVVEQVS